MTEKALKALLARTLPELKEHCWNMKAFGPIAECNKHLPRNEQLILDIEKALKGEEDEA